MIARILATSFMAGFSFIIGCSAYSIRQVHARSHAPSQPEYSPLPHHVPAQAGGMSLRFVMVHDVLHERYLKHGLAYYRERERLSREKLAIVKPDVQAAFLATDDLAVALIRQGQWEQAIALLRKKLDRQEAANLPAIEFYSTYANLGAVLTLRHFEAAASGHEEAIVLFHEGLTFIEKAILVNPQAHFGRESWQAKLSRFHFQAMQEKGILQAKDFIGNRLVAADLERPRVSGRATSPAHQYTYPKLKFDDPVDDPKAWENYKTHRDGIAHVGSGDVPFDEPVLAMVGMWRQGGPDPHLALALGETMLHVGQRFIAWTAFERADRLADRFWPDSKQQQSVRDHCRRRQQEIEAKLTDETSLRIHRIDDDIGPPPLTAAEIGELRSRFEAELAFGEAYQKDYQQYEEKRIAAGKPITDEHFYDEFNAGREPIATPSGSEEWYARMAVPSYGRFSAARAMAWGLFAAGFGALLTAFVIRRQFPPASRRRSN